MGLSRTANGGTGPGGLVPPSHLPAFVAGVSILGLAGAAFAITRTSWTDVGSHQPVGAILFLAVAALVGEVRPLRLPAADEHKEAISTSTAFILALLALGGLGVALVVQLVVSLADDILNRRGPMKTAFNTAQYALSVLAGRLVFSALTGLPFFGGPVAADAELLGPLLAGGVAMVAVNWLLVGAVVSIASSQPLRRVLGANGLPIVVAQVVLLSIGVVAARVAADGVGFVALLCAPVFAVYLTTAAALRQEYLANHDSLTGVGNRNRLYGELNAALTAVHGATDRGPGLVLLDLDHFKDINDTLGHPVGDELLRRVAERLGTAVGATARVSRLGGDEFAVVVHGGLAASQELAHSLLGALEAPVRVGDLELLVRASAGVAVAPQHGIDASSLMKNVDIALYRAKVDRDRTTTYSPEFDVNSVERLQLLADLRTAIDTGQLAVVYQPQVGLADRRMVSVEALLRWQHPTRGDVPPESFIPLAENSGLIARLTAYVLDTALAQLALWRAGGFHLRLAVNLSARHLSDLALPRQVSEALRRHDVPADALVLEVTETGILSDPARVDVVIATLRLLGVAVSVDDYGTGHASLSYLKRLEVDELKIDKSFVSDMGREGHDFIIVRSTIALALDLGLRVIAEGIEDEETARTVQDLGCAIGQGFHLGRPTDPEHIRQRLVAERPSPVPRPRRGG